MDIAYQGFGDDMDGDTYAIKKAVEMGLPVFVSTHFLKTYRCGRACGRAVCGRPQ